MGLRSRVRARLRATLDRVGSVLALGGPVGEPVWERTPAWPPTAIGVGDGADGAQLHPLDRVRAGLPTIAPPPVSPPEPEPAWDDEEDEQDEGRDPFLDAFGLDFPWGSVAQQPHLPEPRPQAAQQRAAPEPAVAPAPPPPPPLGEPADEGERIQLREQVIGVLSTIFDPEIPVDIYALGLIYDVDVSDSRDVEIRMTLTSPNCPAAQSLPGEVEQKSGGVPGVRTSMVDVVWDPPWSPDLMSEEAKLELNID